MKLCRGGCWFSALPARSPAVSPGPPSPIPSLNFLPWQMGVSDASVQGHSETRRKPGGDTPSTSRTPPQMAANLGASIRQERTEAWRGQSTWQPVVEEEEEPPPPPRPPPQAHGPDLVGRVRLLAVTG